MWTVQYREPKFVRLTRSTGGRLLVAVPWVMTVEQIVGTYDQAESCCVRVGGYGNVQSFAVTEKFDKIEQALGGQSV